MVLFIVVYSIVARIGPSWFLGPPLLQSVVGPAVHGSTGRNKRGTTYISLGQRKSTSQWPSRSTIQDDPEERRKKETKLKLLASTSKLKEVG
jgi:hypothetical protein